MNPMTREMFYYFNNAGFCYSICEDKFTVYIAGEKYVFQRIGLHNWRTVFNGVAILFNFQHEVIDWLDSRQ